MWPRTRPAHSSSPQSDDPATTHNAGFFASVLFGHAPHIVTDVSDQVTENPGTSGQPSWLAEITKSSFFSSCTLRLLHHNAYLPRLLRVATAIAICCFPSEVCHFLMLIQGVPNTDEVVGNMPMVPPVASQLSWSATSLGGSNYNCWKAKVFLFRAFPGLPL